MFDVIKDYGLEDGFDGKPVLRNLFTSMVVDGPGEFFAFISRLEKFFAFFEGAYLQRAWGCKSVEFEADTWEPILPEKEKGFLIDDLSTEICVFKDSFSENVPEEVVQELIDVYIEYERNVLSPMRDGYDSLPYRYGRIILEAKMAGYEKKDRLNYLLNLFCEDFVYVFFEWSFDLDAPSAWEHLLNTYDAYESLVLEKEAEGVVEEVLSLLEGFGEYSRSNPKKGFYGKLWNLLEYLKANESIDSEFYEKYCDVVRNSESPGYRIFYRMVFVGLNGLGFGVSEQSRRKLLRSVALFEKYDWVLRRGRELKDSKVVDWVLRREEKDDIIRNLGLKDGIDGAPILDGLFLSMYNEGPKGVLDLLSKLERGFLFCDDLFSSRRLHFEEINHSKIPVSEVSSPNLEGGFVHHERQNHYVVFDKMLSMGVSEEEIGNLVDAYLGANSRIICPILSMEDMNTYRCNDWIFVDTINGIEKDHKVNYLFNLAVYVCFNDFFGRWFASSYSAFDYVENTLRAYFRKVLLSGFEGLIDEVLSKVEGFEGSVRNPVSIDDRKVPGHEMDHIGLRRRINKKVVFPFKDLRMDMDTSGLRSMYRTLFNISDGISKGSPEETKRGFLEYMVRIKAILEVRNRYENLKSSYLYKNSMNLG